MWHTIDSIFSIPWIGNSHILGKTIRIFTTKPYKLSWLIYVTRYHVESLNIKILCNDRGFPGQPSWLKYKKYARQCKMQQSQKLVWWRFYHLSLSYGSLVTTMDTGHLYYCSYSNSTNQITIFCWLIFLTCDVFSKVVALNDMLLHLHCGVCYKQGKNKLRLLISERK